MEFLIKQSIEIINKIENKINFKGHDGTQNEMT